MSGLRHQIRRVRLAYALLREYEREEAERIPYAEAVARLVGYGRRGVATRVAATSVWREAAKSRASEYP